MSLYVVIKEHGPWEGSSILGICETREKAWKVKRKLEKLKIGSKRDFKIKQVLRDVVYPYSIDCNDYVLIEENKP